MFTREAVEERKKPPPRALRARCPLTRQLTLALHSCLLCTTRAALLTFVVHVELVGPAVDAEALIFLVFGVNRAFPGVFGSGTVLAFFHELSCNAFTISKSLRRISTIVGIVHVPNLPITVSVNQKLLDS